MRHRQPTAEWRKRKSERIKTSLIIDRLMAHALGDLLPRPKVVEQIADLVLSAVRDELKTDVSLPAWRKERIIRDGLAVLAKTGMDMSQVRAGEVLLKKTLPDLASTEFRAEVEHNHTVLLPEGMSTQQWLEQVGRETKAIDVTPKH
jgi:hypothetical protein